MAYSATLMLIDGRIVVTEADDTLWIADEIIHAARDPDRVHRPGDLDIDGDLITFGTAGEGLGRLSYRIISHRENPDMTIAVRDKEA